MLDIQNIEWPENQARLDTSSALACWDETIGLLTTLLAQYYSFGSGLEDRKRHILKGIEEQANRWMKYNPTTKNPNINRWPLHAKERIKELQKLGKAANFGLSSADGKVDNGLDETECVWHLALTRQPESSITFRLLEANVQRRARRGVGRVLDATLCKYSTNEPGCRFALHPQNVFSTADDDFRGSMKIALAAALSGENSDPMRSGTAVTLALKVNEHFDKADEYTINYADSSTSIPSSLNGSSSGVAIAVALKALFDGRSKLEENVYRLGELVRNDNVFRVKAVDKIENKIETALKLGNPSTFVVVSPYTDGNPPKLTKKLGKEFIQFETLGMAIVSEQAKAQVNFREAKHIIVTIPDGTTI